MHPRAVCPDGGSADPRTNRTDVGREAVAAAEEAAFGGTTLDVPVARHELHQRLLDVVEGSWWPSCGPPISVSVPRRGSRSSTARASGGGAVEVRLTDEQLTPSTAAHELAHALAGLDHGHDDRFRAAYVDITAVLAGAVAADALAAAFQALGVPAGERAWPAPWRAEGDGFRLVP